MQMQTRVRLVIYALLLSLLLEGYANHIQDQVIRQQQILIRQLWLDAHGAPRRNT
jgi:hypothetical protein